MSALPRVFPASPSGVERLVGSMVPRVRDGHVTAVQCVQAAWLLHNWPAEATGGAWDTALVDCALVDCGGMLTDHWRPAAQFMATSALHRVVSLHSAAALSSPRARRLCQVLLGRLARAQSPMVQAGAWMAQTLLVSTEPIPGAARLEGAVAGLAAIADRLAMDARPMELLAHASAAAPAFLLAGPAGVRTWRVIVPPLAACAADNVDSSAAHASLHALRVAVVCGGWAFLRDDELRRQVNGANPSAIPSPTPLLPRPTSPPPEPPYYAEMILTAAAGAAANASRSTDLLAHRHPWTSFAHSLAHTMMSACRVDTEPQTTHSTAWYSLLLVLAVARGIGAQRTVSLLSASSFHSCDEVAAWCDLLQSS